MKTAAPLLYAPYPEAFHSGPIRKIELLPIKRLVRLSVIRIKSELNINQYLTVYTGVFTIIGLCVSLALAILQVT